MALTDWLRRCGLIAILRGVRPDEVLDIAAALEAEGIADRRGAAQFPLSDGVYPPSG